VAALDRRNGSRLGRHQAPRARRIWRPAGEELSDLQEKLFAEGRSGGERSVLLVLQGLDTAGKGGIVRHVMGMVDPQGVKLASFGVPTAEERAHHYLWRIEKQVAPRGRIGVFDRSHYEDVLVVRVDELVPEAEWQGRYDEINAWEEKLIAGGHHDREGGPHGLLRRAGRTTRRTPGSPRQALEVQPERHHHAQQVACLPAGVRGRVRSGPAPRPRRGTWCPPIGSGTPGSLSPRSSPGRWSRSIWGGPSRRSMWPTWWPRLAQTNQASV
jgi:hypothetical protein